MSKSLSPVVVRRLGHYVYLLVDPRDMNIFYVGKGKGVRAIYSSQGTKNAKVRTRIAAIKLAGLEPNLEILVHNLPNERAAFQVECAAIDLLGLDQLDNKVRGHGSVEFGRTTLRDLVARYEASEVKIAHPAILIRINQLYRYGMSAVELYDATRGVWKISPKKHDVKLAFAVYKGIVKEVYEIADWFQAGSTFSTRDAQGLKSPERWEFVGRVASAKIRRQYVNKSVKNYLKFGLQSPVVYVNC